MRGLLNLGNTCYLNSAIQALFHSKPIAELFGSDRWRRWRHEDRKTLDLADKTADLFSALATDGSGPVMPREFVRAFLTYAHEINDEFRLGAQADAAEAIQILLDGLHTHIAREVIMNIGGEATTPEHRELVASLENWASHYRKEYSPLLDSYYGQNQTRVTCVKCGTCSLRYDPWCVLKVPIPGAETAGAPAPTLDDCLRHAYAPEEIDDYACDTCAAKGKVRLEHGISRYPTHVILSIKRFTNMGAKVRARIPYDENAVDLSAWRAWPTMQPAATYRVTATIEHLGSSRGGHYCMRTRDSTGTGWNVIDDANVAPLTIGGAACPDTYVLFLELQNSGGK